MEELALLSSQKKGEKNDVFHVRGSSGAASEFEPSFML